MFTRFFEAHYDQVYNYAWRRIGPDYADDVAAEALTVAWRRFAEIPADRPLLWLYGCARRIALAKQREIRRRGEAFRLFDETGSGLAAPDDCEQIIQRSTALSALAGLNSSERELVMLVTWEGLEPREPPRSPAAPMSRPGCGCTGRANASSPRWPTPALPPRAPPPPL